MNAEAGRRWRRIGFATAAAAVMACQSPTDVEVADLKGTWVASEARIVDIELPKEYNFDLIELGYTAIFSSPGNGDFEIRLDPPEGDPVYVRGTLETDRTNVTVTTSEGVGSGDVFLEDEQVALNLTAGLTYDFSGKGEEKPAKLLLVMDRESPEPTPL